MSLRLCLLLSLLVPSLAFAGKVQKLDPAKKLVTVSEGSKTGFLKKKKVCFYDPSKKKVACGIIRSVKPTSSVIFVKKDTDFAKIKVGMVANLDILRNKNVKITITDEAETPAEPEVMAPNYIGLFGGFPLVDTVGYQNIVYETPLGDAVTSMWSVDSPVQSVSFGAELGFGIKSFTLAIGGRSRTFAPKRVASDYDDKDDNGYFEDYAESIGKGSSIGFWADFYYLRYEWGLASLNIGNGIDFDSSTVTFTMDKKSEDDNSSVKLYDVKSSLKTLSLRTNLILDFNFGTVGFKMGTLIFVPISQTPEISVTQTDPFTAESLVNVSAEEDVKSALGHKAKFGVDLMIMGYFAY